MRGDEERQREREQRDGPTRPGNRESRTAAPRRAGHQHQAADRPYARQLRDAEPGEERRGGDERDGGAPVHVRNGRRGWTRGSLDLVCYIQLISCSTEELIRWVR